jgi:uncharacterized protein YbjT (DUF2867 family)
MILITGATGTVGSALVQQLIESRQPVRVFTRDKRKVTHLERWVECAEGDLNKPETILPAMQGIEQTFLVTASTQQDMHVIEAARQSGIRHIVKLSTIEAGHEPMIGHGKYHREREDLIRASGLDWTFLRPTMFMSTALGWSDTISRQNKVVYPGGEGKVGVIDPWDIAAVAAAVLTNRGHEGQEYALTGPELLSIGDMVQILGRLLDKPIQYQDMDDGAAGAMMRHAKLPEYAIEGLLSAFAGVRAGRFAYLTDAVVNITGHKPRNFETWCREHLSAFQ